MCGFPDRGGNAGGSFHSGELGASIRGRELSNLFETYGPYRLPSLKRPCIKVCGAAIPRGVSEGAKVNLIGRISGPSYADVSKRLPSNITRDQQTSFSLTGADNEGSSSSSLALASGLSINGRAKGGCLSWTPSKSVRLSYDIGAEEIGQEKTTVGQCQVSLLICRSVSSRRLFYSCISKCLFCFLKEIRTSSLMQVEVSRIRSGH